MPRAVNLDGQRFFALTVIRRIGTRWGQSLWLCRCDCGNYCERTNSQLHSTEHPSCGCKTRNVQKETHTTHGHSRERLYRIWKGMKARCNCPSQKCYKYYGGKGIKVCEQWSTDFDSFRKWAINNEYSDELTIDRIDSDMDYEPSNCWWVSMTVQNRNKKGARENG